MFWSRNTFGFLVALALSISCSAPTIRADIEAYASSNLSLEGLRSFSYRASEDESFALRNQALYLQVHDLLVQQGLQEATSADFQVTLQTDTQKTTIEYPAHYEMRPHSFSQRGYHASPYPVPGRSVPAFAHHLALDFRAANGELLWQGTIDLVHRSRDLSSLMKMFLPVLLNEFPAPSGRSMQRRVRVGD